MHVPAWSLIRGNGNTEIATRGLNMAYATKMESFVKTPLTIMNTVLDITVGNHHFDPFSLVLWPLENQHWANVTQ